MLTDDVRLKNMLLFPVIACAVLAGWQEEHLLHKTTQFTAGSRRLTCS